MKRRIGHRFSSAGLVGAAFALQALAACNLVAGLSVFDHVKPADAGTSDAEAGSPPPGPPDSSPDENDAPDVPDTFVADAPSETGPTYTPAVRYDFESGEQGWVRNQYNDSQNWGVVSVLQALDPVQSGETDEDAGSDAGSDARSDAGSDASADAGDARADAPSGEAAAMGPDAFAGAGLAGPGDADTPETSSLAARYRDGGANHVLRINYDYSLKPATGGGSYLEAVNSGFQPTTLGTVPGLALSIDVYVDHVADIDPALQVLVQDSSYNNCFFAHFSLLGVSDRTWVTLTATDTGICSYLGTLTSPQQMCFQFEPHTGSGSIYIDNVTW